MLSDELFTLQDRPVRRPLAEWAGELLDRLACRTAPVVRSKEDDEAVVGCFSNGSLVAAHHGRLDVANALCRVQVRWTLAVVRATGRLAMSESAIVPWINIARLDRLARRYGSSLWRLERIDAGRRASRLALGAGVVGRTHWDAIRASNPHVDLFLEADYVMESLKTLLRAGRYEEVFAFRADPRFRPAQVFAAESRIVALARLGDMHAVHLAEKLVAIENDVAAAQGPGRRIFALHLAEVLGHFGDGEASSRAARELIGDARVLLGRGAELLDLVFVRRVLAALATSGEREAARELAEEAHASACLLGDEPLQCDFLIHLVTLSPPPGVARWRAALEALGRTTAYPVVRARAIGAEAPAARCPEIDRLFEALIALDPARGGGALSPLRKPGRRGP